MRHKLNSFVSSDVFWLVPYPLVNPIRYASVLIAPENSGIFAQQPDNPLHSRVSLWKDWQRRKDTLHAIREKKLRVTY